MDYLPIFRKLMLFILPLLFIYAQSLRHNYEVYKIHNGCPSSADNLFLTIIMKNIQVRVVNNTHMVKFDVDVLEDITEDLKVQFQVTKCKDKDSLDSCDLFHTITIPFSCKVMDFLGPWTVFVKALEPPYPCPMKKGHYRIMNPVHGTSKAMETLRVPKGYYLRFIFKAFEAKSKKIRFCAVSEGQY